ncbi:MAG TPA: glycosyltransferase family 39 protein [Azospira sp.]|nr:glycosyltransferase family 39 protein [Azospira sp.]
MAAPQEKKPAARKPGAAPAVGEGGSDSTVAATPLQQRFSPRHLVWGAAALFFVFRLWLAAVMPITGDEAYFIYWGAVPDWGFYDHPPMVGWWLAPLLRLSWAEWVVRLPVLLLPFALAALVGWLVRRAPMEFATERGWLAALLVLFLPTSVWNIFITTDTPLIFFSLLAVVAYVLALERPAGSKGWWLLHALAGLGLGLAFLSKYFAVLLGVAFLVHTLVARRDEGWKRWLGFALLTAVALLGPALNIWWNCSHCWANIMFNLYNRHESSGWGKTWTTPFLYVASLAYVATPFIFAYLWKYRQALKDAVAQPGLARTTLWLVSVPLGLFAVLSLVKEVGLHWLLSFIPLLCLLAAVALPVAALRRLAVWMGGLALLHVAAIVVVSRLPLSTWEDSHLYDGIVLTFRSQELLERLEPYANDYVFASDGYSNAVTLGYNARRYFFVFGVGSSHARHDDIMTDVRQLEGKNILVLRKTEPQREEYAPYFREVEILPFEVEGVMFYQVLGRGFDYVTYRDRVLREIKQRYYRIPSFLPMTGCYFCERYFPGEECR